MKKPYLNFLLAAAVMAMPGSSTGLNAQVRSGKRLEIKQNSEVTAPYNLQKCLLRAEELFRANDYREALIFYYEGLAMTTNEEVKAKLHFRIGECLEGVRRFDFAAYHYKLAMQGKLP